MIKSLRMEARHDPLLAQVLAKAETQRFMVNKGQRFQYGNFEYSSTLVANGTGGFPHSDSAET
jgi:hypothetical protein